LKNYNNIPIFTLKLVADMTIILKKGQHLEDLLPKATSVKGDKKLDAKKYLGVLKRKEDPLEIQKKMRDEWE
jgi:hypothetical protein